MAELLLDRYLADILRLAELARDSAHSIETYAHCCHIASIAGRAIQEAEFELEQAEREQSG